MKVLLFCGSPHAKGTTAYALSLVAEEIEAAGIETTTFQVGTDPIRGCIGCHGCRKTGRCVFDDDAVNGFIDQMEGSDGLIIGAPTYFFGAAGQAKAFLDRAFYAAPASVYAHKPAAVLSVARRAGTVPSVSDLVHFPMIYEMPIVTTCYQPVTFGYNGQEASQDDEGVRIMRTLGRNMAWMLKSLEAARAAGVEVPEPLPPAHTNFIR
jgi:multimeric flavodoxin WrbA